MTVAPWSVKGVPPEDREAAKMAARKAGVPLGTWLSQTIRTAAAQELKRSVPPGYRPITPSRDERPLPGYPGWSPAAPEPAAAPVPPAPPQRDGRPIAAAGPMAFGGQMAGGAHMAGGAQMAGGAEADPTARPPALTTEAVLQSIRSLGQKIEQTEARTLERLEPIAAKVESLAQQVEEVRARGSGPSTAPVERAVMRLSERLQRLEHASGAASSRPGLLGRLFRRS
ncbi:MAG: hypothetical protein OHK0024_36630 [Thalassobaculales bacterium]